MRRPTVIATITMSLIVPSRANSIQIEFPLEGTPCNFDELRVPKLNIQIAFTDLEEINGTKELLYPLYNVYDRFRSKKGGGRVLRSLHK
jgi:hypothetical protein